MATQRSNKPKKSVAKPAQVAKASNKKTRAKSKTALTTSKSNKAILKPDEVTPIARTNRKHAKTKAIDPSRGSTTRISFVVRVTIDEHQQVQRTEIQHVETGKRESFLYLDAQQLVTFMTAYITRANMPPGEITELSFSRHTQTPTPISLMPEPHLVVSNVQVFRPKHAYAAGLILTAHESFVVRVQFQVKELPARFLNSQDSLYKIEIYANEITTGRSELLTTHGAELMDNVFEYLTQITTPGLSPGFYHLLTVVSIGKSTKLANYYHGPIVQIM